MILRHSMQVKIFTKWEPFQTKIRYFYDNNHLKELNIHMYEVSHLDFFFFFNALIAKIFTSYQESSMN